MLRRAALLTVAVCVPVLLQAQRVRFGLAAGTSLVGGGDSRALVDAGGFGSLLGTNPDQQSSEVVVTRGGMGLGLQTGVGLRIRMGQHSLLLEWRYGQALNNTRGIAFMPLTAGIVF